MNCFFLISIVGGLRPPNPLMYCVSIYLFIRFLLSVRGQWYSCLRIKMCHFSFEFSYIFATFIFMFRVPLGLPPPPRTKILRTLMLRLHIVVIFHLKELPEFLSNFSWVYYFIFRILIHYFVNIINCQKDKY